MRVMRFLCKGPDPINLAGPSMVLFSMGQQNIIPNPRHHSSLGKSVNESDDLHVHHEIWQAH